MRVVFYLQVFKRSSFSRTPGRGPIKPNVWLVSGFKRFYVSVPLSHLWPVQVPSRWLLNLFDMTLLVTVLSHLGVEQDVLG